MSSNLLITDFDRQILSDDAFSFMKANKTRRRVEVAAGPAAREFFVTSTWAQIVNFDLRPCHSVAALFYLHSLLQNLACS